MHYTEDNTTKADIANMFALFSFIIFPYFILTLNSRIHQFFKKEYFKYELNRLTLNRCDEQVIYKLYVQAFGITFNLINYHDMTPILGLWYTVSNRFLNTNICKIIIYDLTSTLLLYITIICTDIFTGQLIIVLTLKDTLKDMHVDFN